MGGSETQENAQRYFQTLSFKVFSLFIKIYGFFPSQLGITISYKYIILTLFCFKNIFCTPYIVHIHLEKAIIRLV